MKLFSNSGSAGFFEFLDHLSSFVLGNAFFDGAEFLNESLSVAESKTGKFANNFNNGNLVSAEVLKNDVEFGLFFFSGSTGKLKPIAFSA